MKERKLDDWIEGWLQYRDKSEPPLLYNHWVAVSLIASALERKVYLKWHSKLYPNFYIVLVGPAGRCRKGTAMNPGRKMLNELKVKVAAEATTREALIRRLKESSGSVPMVTGDGKTVMPNIYSALTVYSEELTVFLGYNNQQLMSDLADWYDCRDKWIYDTKNMGTDDIDGVWVNLIGATTPELLQTTLPRDAVGGGLTSRIIFVYEENKRQTSIFPFETLEEMTLYNTLLSDLRKINSIQGAFTYDKSFLDKWEQWYPIQSGKNMFNDDRMAGYAERRPTHVLKLSMVMNVSRKNGSMNLTDIDFNNAIALLNNTEKKMRFTFSGVGENVLAFVIRRIMNTIADVRQIEFNRLLRIHYHDVDYEDLKTKVLPTLERIGFCEVDYQKSTKNPTIIFIKETR